MKVRFRWIPIFGLLLYVGCASDLSTVTGKVTLDGEPLADAFVEFTPQVPGGSMSYGKTNSRGDYDLMFSSSKRGAMPGESIVRITTADVGDMGKPNTREQVPARYNRNSELRATVQENQSNVLNFDLVSEGGKVVQPKIDPGN
jgi:hypothetical protein